MPIGTVSFEPTKVSLATVLPVLLCRSATYMGDFNLEEYRRRKFRVSRWKR